MTNKKKVYLVTVGAICLMFLFPPIIGFTDEEAYWRNPYASGKDVGYKPIFEMLEKDRMNINRIAAQILAVFVIGGIASRLVKD